MLVALAAHAYSVEARVGQHSFGQTVGIVEVAFSIYQAALVVAGIAQLRSQAGLKELLVDQQLGQHAVGRQLF